ncbi:hypothetical protein G4228_009487 [Cervus hanglu yarkandensis]|nr:hypothetical protein G4228_009487 [Cervus hanglu yarkandensis]
MKMQNLRDGNYYACKQMKQHFESDRKSGSLALICELMEMNIYELIQGIRHPLSEKKITHYMYQLCKSLDHMHRNGIFHRDVKPENILVKQDVLKLGDFGSCRSVYSRQPYTEYISTRWYRAPECLLTDGFYGFKMDLWSAGCVLYEMASLQPLFPGANELDQISRIHDVMGTPAEKTLTKFKQAAEKQALARARRKAPAPFPERPTAPELNSTWQTAQEGRKQKQPARPEENHPRRQGPAYLMELPRLKLSGAATLASYSSPALQSVFAPKVPLLRPLKCVGAAQKTDTQKDIKPSLKQYRLPTIERRGGGY